jgi:RimJ/RimL family protein N-acetyltransferase
VRRRADGQAIGQIEITAAVDTRNAASRRVLDALGFVSDGVAVPADPIRGEAAFDYLYVLDVAKSPA